MERYLNESGHSGVKAFEIRDRSIIVEFKDGKYLYTYHHPGRDEVEKMKELALKGEGLSTYISTHIREDYEKKLN